MCRNCLGEDFAKDLSEHDDPANPQFAFLLDTHPLHVYYCQMVKHFQVQFQQYDQPQQQQEAQDQPAEATAQPEQPQEPTPMAV